MYKLRVITILVLSLFVVVSTDSSGKAAPKPEPAGPYFRMDCESWTRLKIRCTAVVIDGWGPVTVRWYVNGVFHSAVGNLYPPAAYTSMNFACSPSQPRAYSAEAIDSLGGVTYAVPLNGAPRCYSGNP